MLSCDLILARSDSNSEEAGREVWWFVELRSLPSSEARLDRDSQKEAETVHQPAIAESGSWLCRPLLTTQRYSATWVC